MAMYCGNFLRRFCLQLAQIHENPTPKVSLSHSYLPSRFECNEWIWYLIVHGLVKKKSSSTCFFYSSLLLLFITYKDCVYFAAFLFFAFIFVLYFLLLNATGSILHSLDGSLELWLPELNCNSAKKQPIQLFSSAIDLDKWLQSSRLEDEKVHHEAKHLAQRAIRFGSLGGFLPEFGTFHQMGVQFGLQFCSIS